MGAFPALRTDDVPDPVALRVGLLGPVVLWGPGGKTMFLKGREARLLATLALRAGHPVWRSHLVDAVWGDAPPQSPSDAAHNVVYRLRQMMAAAGIVEGIPRQASGYELELGRDAVDAGRFEMIIDSLDGYEGPERGDLIREALSLWRGQALEGLTGTSTLLAAEAMRLDALRIVAVENRIEIDLAVGRHRVLIPELTALTAEWPLRESLWGYLMVALYQSGRAVDALRTYRRMRDRLIEETGVEPGRHLQRLEVAILEGREPGGLLTGEALASRWGVA